MKKIVCNFFDGFLIPHKYQSCPSVNPFQIHDQITLAVNSQIQDCVNHFDIAYEQLQTIITNKERLTSPTLLYQVTHDLCYIPITSQLNDIHKKPTVYWTTTLFKGYSPAREQD